MTVEQLRSLIRFTPGYYEVVLNRYEGEILGPVNSVSADGESCVLDLFLKPVRGTVTPRTVVLGTELPNGATVLAVSDGKVLALRPLSAKPFAVWSLRYDDNGDPVTENGFYSCGLDRAFRHFKGQLV